MQKENLSRLRRFYFNLGEEYFFKCEIIPDFKRLGSTRADINLIDKSLGRIENEAQRSAMIIL